MHPRNIFDRREYDTDADFESVVDRAAAKLATEQKREFVYRLLRDCRGCGTETTYESINTIRMAQTGAQHVVCKSCGHSVLLTREAEFSLGRFITLWNTTGLTIEACPS